MSEVSETVNTVSSMPIANLVILIVGVIVFVLVAGWAIKKFGLQISKGAIKAKDYEYDQSCQTTMYHLQENIETIDYETRRNIRQETILCNYLIANIDTVDSMCPPARRSMFYAFKEPFYEIINNNHFTRELMPGNYDIYRTCIFNALQNAYHNLLTEYGLDDCDKDNLPEWLKVEDDFYKITDEWLFMAQGEVIKSCRRKIELYEREKKAVSESKHWSEILQGCIDKNQEYIRVISDRLEKNRKC